MAEMMTGQVPPEIQGVVQRRYVTSDRRVAYRDCFLTRLSPNMSTFLDSFTTIKHQETSLPSV